jgi:N-methylhydantoinase A/oxoprolinase/acetone carboxylase beta subunit
VAELRLGVDVGGTHTDAVVLDEANALIAKAKVPTTPDVRDGVGAAIGSVIASSGIEPEAVTRAMLGTTQVTNAVLERRNLLRVAVIRIGSPLTLALPPLASWPEALRAAVSAGECIVGGGFEINGQEIAELDEEAVVRFLDGCADGVEAVAVASVFAPVSAEHELRAAELVRRELGDVHVSLSHEVGTLGLIERENATTLNAALVPVAAEVATAFSAALADHSLCPETFFAQNDGTLMALEFALEFPVLTIGSGPANSMRGAARLSGIDDAVVVDVGGTSTDIGVLVNGFPREASVSPPIAGVPTNFRMPDLRSLALGGGSVIEASDGQTQLGPHSVGFRLTQEALVFGGETATLTDAAVAAGRSELGEKPITNGHRPRLREALVRADAIVAEAVDGVKAGPGDVTVVAVGGGSFLIAERMPGVSEIHRPADYDVANAIGAATAPVSGQAERICPNRSDRRAVALDEAKQEACLNAVRAGADPRAVEVIEVEEVPLTYLVDPAIRIRVKAAGELT